MRRRGSRRSGLGWLILLVPSLAFLVLPACDPTPTYRPSVPSVPSYTPPSSIDQELQASWRRAQAELETALSSGDTNAAQRVLVGFQRQIVAAESRGVATQEEIHEARRFVSAGTGRVKVLKEETAKAKIRETVDLHLQRETFAQAYRFLDVVIQSQTETASPVARFCKEESLRVETAEIDSIERRVREDLARASQASLRKASGTIGLYLNTRDFSAAGMARLEELERLVGQTRSANPPPQPPVIAVAPPPVAPPSVGTPPVDPPEAQGLAFVYIPSTTYSFGTPPDEPGRESIEPEPTALRVEGFFISITEVTQEAFVAVQPRRSWTSFAGPRLPAHSITFEEAQEFCEDLTLRSSRMVFSLPTEVEWEVAARAGKPPSYGPVVGLPTHRRRFLAGLVEASQALQNYAVFSANKTGPGPVEVRQKRPNPLGLYDMHGNVAEWSRPEERLPDLYSDVLVKKPIRGGSVQSPYNRCRAGARALELATTSTPTIGLRVVARPR